MRVQTKPATDSLRGTWRRERSTDEGAHSALFSVVRSASNTCSTSKQITAMTATPRAPEEEATKDAQHFRKQFPCSANLNTIPSFVVAGSSLSS